MVPENTCPPVYYFDIQCWERPPFNIMNNQRDLCTIPIMLLSLITAIVWANILLWLDTIIVI